MKAGRREGVGGSDEVGEGKGTLVPWEMYTGAVWLGPGSVGQESRVR